MAEIMPNYNNVVPLKRMMKQNTKKKILVSKLADNAKKAVWPAIIFNLSNEPAFKFNLSVFGDKSQDVHHRTSYFTQKQVIYLETDSSRFELCKKATGAPSLLQIESADDTPYLYTLSQINDPVSLDNAFFSDPDT